MNDCKIFYTSELEKSSTEAISFYLFFMKDYFPVCIHSKTVNHMAISKKSYILVVKILITSIYYRYYLNALEIKKSGECSVLTNLPLMSPIIMVY